MRQSRLFTYAWLMLSLVSVFACAQFSVRYEFGSKSGDPCNPAESGIVAQGRDGNLYSTAPWCGANAYGAVFKITPSGPLTVLYSFGGKPDDGLNPRGGLTLGTDGNFYGTTTYGGTYGYGTVFKITLTGQLTVLYSFMNGTDGAVPFAPPVEGTDGNFYGTTCGCYPGAGTIYKITPSGVFTSLYQFNFPIAYPYAPLVQGKDGDFYGTVYTSGTGGIVFKITRAGSFTMLHNFTNGDGPMAPLVQGSGGNFYGTTIAGGLGYGTVYKITPTGTLTVLHDMNGTTDGYNPYGGLVQTNVGDFLGVNAGGGTILNCQGAGCGTIFKISPQGSYSVLYNFDYTHGAYPSITLLQHTSGVLYGDTWGGGITNGTCTQSGGGCSVFYGWNGHLPKFVTLLPYSGKIGQTIEFLGQGLTGATAVSFDGIPAIFTVHSATYLTATVPSGADTGFVTVKTPVATVKSNKKFRVIP